MFSTIIQDFVPKFWSVYRWWVVIGLIPILVVALMAFHHVCGTGRGKTAIPLLVIAGVFSVVISLFGIPELLDSIGGDGAARITAIFYYGLSAVLLICLVGMAFDDKFCERRYNRDERITKEAGNYIEVKISHVLYNDESFNVFCDYEDPVTGRDKSFLSRPFYWEDMGMTKKDAGKVTGALVGKPVKVYVKGTEKRPYKQYYVDVKLSPKGENGCADCVVSM